MLNLKERIDTLARWMFKAKHLVVYPAADMPRLALESGAKLVIINQGETPLDSVCHLRFSDPVGEVLPAAVSRLKGLLRQKA